MQAQGFNLSQRASKVMALGFVRQNYQLILIILIRTEKLDLVEKEDKCEPQIYIYIYMIYIAIICRKFIARKTMLNYFNDFSRILL